MPNNPMLAGALLAGRVDNLTATTDPTAANDSRQGYGPGSVWINATTGTIWRCNSAAVGAAVWVPMDVSDHPGFVTGRFYSTYGGTISVTAAIPGADTLYLYPWTLKQRVTVTSLFVRCIGAGAGSSVKAALWANGSGGRPVGTPLLGSDTPLDTSTSGIKSTAIASVTLNPGIYWLGSKASGTMPTLVSIQGTQLQLSATLGAASPGVALNTASTNQVTAISVPDAYANNIMAANLTGATFSDVVGGSSSGVPVIGVGV